MQYNFDLPDQRNVVILSQCFENKQIFAKILKRDVFRFPSTYLQLLYNSSSSLSLYLIR